MPEPVVRRIDHVVCLVGDVDAAFETYTDRLGFPVSWRKGTGEGWHSAAVWLGNASIELLSPELSSDSPAASFFGRALESRGEGAFLVAFEPAGIQLAVTDLRARGVQVTDSRTRAYRRSPGRRRAQLQDGIHQQ